MANVTDSLDNIIKQDIQPGIDDALVELSPLFSEVYNSTMGVVRSNIGRDWKVIKTLLTSLAGQFKAIGAAGGDTVYSTSTPYTVHGSSVATFPGLVGAVSPGYVQKEFALQEMLGNIHLPQEYLRADRLTASIGSAVAATVKQTARMVALAKSNFFFTPDRTLVALGTGDGATALTGGATSDEEVTITLSAVSRIRNLLPGMRVDLWSSNGATQRNGNGALVVYSVDPETKAVRLDHADTTSVFSSQVVNTDVITLRDSKGNGPAGLETWIKSSGTLYTNLALATYPQFKSKIAAISGSLTEDVLRKYLAGFIQGHGAMMAPDTLLTTEGVLNDHLDQVDGDRRWVVQGQSQKYAGGFEILPFSLNGKTFRWKTGEQVPGGYLYGLKLGQQNIKRYMPPKLPGSTSQSEFGNIEFTAPLGGSNGIWEHALSSSAMTKYVQAPFVCLEEIVPDVIPAIKLTGLTEDLA